MGIFCSDKSMTTLAGLGYNVVRHPSANFRPLILIGKQGGEFLQLGSLSQLITNPPGPAPSITFDQPGAGIQGESSNKLDLAIGANILGSIIGAMGGNLGINITYTDARRVEFRYTDVTLDSVVPLDVGNYLRDGDVDAGNLILQQYVLGNGELFVVTNVAKSKKFSVSYEKKNSLGAKVDVPALQSLAGANVNVSADAKNLSLITFDGPTQLGFAFQCFQVGVVDGQITLTSVKAGAVAAADKQNLAEKPPMLAPAGLLEIR
jgi:hypothetical protein